MSARGLAHRLFVNNQVFVGQTPGFVKTILIYIR